MDKNKDNDYWDRNHQIIDNNYNDSICIIHLILYNNTHFNLLMRKHTNYSVSYLNNIGKIIVEYLDKLRN